MKVDPLKQSREIARAVFDAEGAGAEGEATTTVERVTVRLRQAAKEWAPPQTNDTAVYVLLTLAGLADPDTAYVDGDVRFTWEIGMSSNSYGNLMTVLGHVLTRLEALRWTWDATDLQTAGSKTSISVSVF